VPDGEPVPLPSPCVTSASPPVRCAPVVSPGAKERNRAAGLTWNQSSSAGAWRRPSRMSASASAGASTPRGTQGCRAAAAHEERPRGRGSADERQTGFPLDRRVDQRGQTRGQRCADDVVGLHRHDNLVSVGRSLGDALLIRPGADPVVHAVDGCRGRDPGVALPPGTCSKALAHYVQALTRPGDRDHVSSKDVEIRSTDRRLSARSWRCASPPGDGSQEPERWSSLSVVANTRKAARCRGTGGPAKYMS
jgi:hypothetical protein